MTNVLPDNHAFLTAELELASFTKSMLDNSKIKLFDYVRLYYDGHIALVSTDSRIIHYAFNKNVPIASAPDDFQNKRQFRYLIKSDGIYSQVLHDFRTQFETENLINFIERNEAYTDVFCFGGHINNNSIDYYLNNIDLLQNFISAFKDIGKSFIQHAENNKMAITPPMQCNLLQAPNLSNRIQIPNINHEMVSISVRENDVLQYVMRGYSALNIAEKLKISRRTVEHHIEGIKQKTGTRTKFALVALLSGHNNQ